VIEAVAVQDLTTRQTEPRVTLFGTDPGALAGFGPGIASLADLGPDEVLLDEEAADELGAAAGDELTVFGRAGPVAVTARQVVDFDGAGGDGPAVLSGLALAQRIVGEPGRIRHVLVSNDGGAVAGAAHTDETTAALAPLAARYGLEVQPIKQEALEIADDQGASLLSLFSTFGTFSIAAGILLIFLIFVMLAAERRTEMGIERAIGTQRGHLVQTFVFEGVLYDVLAGVVGAVAGLGVGYVMLQAVSGAFGAEELELVHDVRPQSLWVAFGLGVLLTLAVVTISAWRVSLLDITTAIRNLPSPAVRQARAASAWRGAVLTLAGVAITALGVSGGQAMPFLVGASVVIGGAVALVRAAGVGDRVAFTLGGSALVLWWLQPLDALKGVTGELAYDFSVWITGGLVIVLGATWVVMWNADIVLGGLTRLTRGLRSAAPIVRMAVAYPLRSRMRTSMTLAMFTLVVFTLVAGSTINGSFLASFDDVERYGGGFDARAVAAPMRPIGDIETALASATSIDPDDVEAIGAQSLVPLELRQVGDPSFADYPLRGLDDPFLARTTYGLSAMAQGYDSPAEVWQALAETPGLAVVDPFAAPRRDNFNFATPPDFTLEGFFVEDRTFDPVEVEVHDPTTGRTTTVTVIGVFEDAVPWEMAGLTTSQETLAAFGDRAVPTTFWFDLAPGVDPDRLATEIEDGLLEYGVEAESLQHSLDRTLGANRTFFRLMQGFMGLGLVVGVVALGVISARAVVERRQQIGVLRAIGFQPAMVRLGFLMEASFVALTGIVVGTALGLAMGYNVVAYFGDQQDIGLTVPWLDLAVIFTVVYIAALASTLLPALRGSRIYPAEALRYQ
jgi:putative ABC transport system permease protein